MMPTPRPIAPAILLLIGSLTLTAFARAGEGEGEDEESEMRTIAVSGTGKVSAPPNVAEVSVGVMTQAATASEGLAANNERMAALHAILKNRGVAAKDIQTSQLSVQPQYTQPPPFQPGQPPQRDFVAKIAGYQVQNTVQITARDLNKLGLLLDDIVKAGANQMHGISFRIDEPEALLDVARKGAMADARKKAELMAGEAKVVVGPPIAIRDEAAMPPPQPRAMSLRAASVESAVPIASGEQELRVTVHVVYELKVPQ